MTMHSLEYLKEREILCIGTNKGSILAFSLENDIDQCMDYNQEEETSGPQKFIVINDKDLSDDPGTMVIQTKFERLKSKLPIYKMQEPK